MSVQILDKKVVSNTKYANVKGSVNSNNVGKNSAAKSKLKYQFKLRQNFRWSTYREAQSRKIQEN